MTVQGTSGAPSRLAAYGGGNLSRISLSTSRICSSRTGCELVVFLTGAEAFSAGASRPNPAPRASVCHTASRCLPVLASPCVWKVSPSHRFDMTTSLIEGAPVRRRV